MNQAAIIYINNLIKQYTIKKFTLMTQTYYVILFNFNQLIKYPL